MITRAEFYISCLIILAFIAGGFYITHKPAPVPGQTDQSAIWQVQRDSLLAAALAKDLKADSLQAVINRRDLDIKEIKKKYEGIKKDILVLSPDSTLRLFLRSTSH